MLLLDWPCPTGTMNSAAAFRAACSNSSLAFLARGEGGFHSLGRLLLLLLLLDRNLQLSYERRDLLAENLAINRDGLLAHSSSKSSAGRLGVHAGLVLQGAVDVHVPPSAAPRDEGCRQRPWTQPESQPKATRWQGKSPREA